MDTLKTFIYRGHVVVYLLEVNDFYLDTDVSLRMRGTHWTREPAEGKNRIGTARATKRADMEQKTVRKFPVRFLLALIFSSLLVSDLDAEFI